MGSNQPQLADYCEYFLEQTRRPCYAQAGFVQVRPSGQTLRFFCAEHLPAWASQIQGRYIVLERDEWEARGGGYRGLDAGELMAVGGEARIWYG